MTTDTNADCTDLLQQNRMIISLLGRMVFPDEKLISIIQKKSKKPDEILKAYNLCTGEFSIPEIAKKSGIAPQSLREAITKWEKTGIIFVSIPKSGHEQMPVHLYEVHLSESLS